MANERIKHIFEMLKNEPYDSFLNYALALEYANQNNVQKAIETIENLLERDENYLGAYYQLAKFYETTSNFKMAINTYNRGKNIAQKQKNIKTFNELNQALLLLDDE